MILNLSRRHRWHPDNWTPTGPCNTTYDRPAIGNVIGWRYATWRVIDLTVRADADLTDDDRREIALYKPAYRDGVLPYVVVLRHERGPILVKHTQRLHDGTTTVHAGIRAGRHHQWNILNERYAVCSCCNHPYPCQEYAQEQIAEAESERLGRLLDSHAPGVCAACRGPVTTRQKVIVFPEPSLMVPGAPGPTYHANRWACRRKARSYELDMRLPAYPDAARLASCPGLLFIHEDGGREECTAEGMCTGLHGPKSNREGIACYTQTYMGGGDGCYPRPPSPCTHRGCLGADHSLGAPDPFSVGDVWHRGRG